MIQNLPHLKSMSARTANCFVNLIDLEQRSARPVISWEREVEQETARPVMWLGRASCKTRAEGMEVRVWPAASVNDLCDDYCLHSVEISPRCSADLELNP